MSQACNLCKPQKACIHCSMMQRRLIIEHCETVDSPVTYSQLESEIFKIRHVCGQLGLVEPSDPLIATTIMQQSPFTWQLLSETCREISLDMFEKIYTPKELEMKITSGFPALENFIPRDLKTCYIMKTPITEGLIALHSSRPPLALSFEACIHMMQHSFPSEIRNRELWPATHPKSIEAVHDCAVMSLVNSSQTREEDRMGIELVGKFVEVLIEGNHGEYSEDLFLVTEDNEDTGQLFGFWLYKPNDMPGDWDTVSETGSVDTIEEEAYEQRLFFSDHFDTVSKETLVERCKGPTPVPTEEVVSRIAGAWSTKHNTCFLGRNRVQSFVRMLNVLATTNYSSAGLKLWPQLYDRVMAILPSGIDSSLERAGDLRDELWKEINIYSLADPTHGVCDCCGMQRFLTYQLNDGWYIGKTCAAKIEGIAPDIDAVRDM